MLLPDTSPTALQQPEIAAWIDAVKEEGYALTVYSNAQFLEDGGSARLKYRGIIVPDQSQVRMSDELVAALKRYTSGGGQLMLVYDAGALTSTGFYSIPKSRFSDMVGVDYVLYDELRDFTIGLGPAVGKLRVMRALDIPPGKSLGYSPELLADSRIASSRGIVSFLPSGPTNVGGLIGHDHEIYANIRPTPRGPVMGSSGLPLATRHATAVEANPVRGATPMKPTPAPPLDPDDSYLAKVEPDYETPHTAVNYGYNVVSYPSYVTRGSFDGEPLLTSPYHGLMAGTRNYGAGRVLFVNMPLVYLKLRTDGMPMHGFIDYFSRRMLNLPQLTSVPDGTAGLILNWHLDSKEAQAPTQQLKDMGVWKSGPFSIHMTAGPDTVNFGDGDGWDLPNNSVAQRFLREFVASGHEVGSHGGWIHDYYGFNASETNGETFQQYLALNDDAVTAVIGRPSREYSAPLGNNPLWAVSWLENKGITAFYFLGHTGMAPTRSWRNGTLTHPSIWTIPLTTYGTTATFEDWQEQKVPKEIIRKWHEALIAFAINNRTTRLIYAHPPGAVLWPDVLKHLLDSAERQSKHQQFRWYTMARIAQFMSDRRDVTWSVDASPTGAVRVTASHPSSLAGMTWCYRKSAYTKPRLLSGKARIADSDTDWVVRAEAGSGLQFEAAPRLGVQDDDPSWRDNGHSATP
ncbi:hypothetical protein DAT35_08310 [Vitiosangium sp. GDMCC 1.1324]|nr:hypothetical protein DAT35_08310 [Vitiosangium sp. GDMCC 1.1324]